MIIRATQGQTIYDLAIKHYGCYEGVFVLMEDNNLSLTSELIAGQNIIIRDVIPELNDTNIAVALYYKTNGLSVNSQYHVPVITAPFYSGSFYGSFFEI